MLQSTIYCFYTPSHERLFNQYFAPSIPESFQIKARFLKKQFCPSSEFRSTGWKETQIEKVSYWIESIKDSYGKVITCSDVDAQFFGITPSIIENSLRDRDIAIQWNGCCPEPLCSGFFICRANQATLELFQRIKNYLIENTKCLGEQEALNRILGTWFSKKRVNREQRLRSIHSEYTLLKTTNPLSSSIKNRLFGYYKSCLNVRWAVLPHRLYWLPGYLYDSPEELSPPRGMVLHHANWTIGIENKLTQLEVIKKHNDSQNL